MKDEKPKVAITFSTSFVRKIIGTKVVYEPDFRSNDIFPNPATILRKVQTSSIATPHSTGMALTLSVLDVTESPFKVMHEERWSVPHANYQGCAEEIIAGLVQEGFKIEQTKSLYGAYMSKEAIALLNQ